MAMFLSTRQSLHTQSKLILSLVLASSLLPEHVFAKGRKRVPQSPSSTLTSVTPPGYSRTLISEMDRESLQFEKVAQTMLVKDDCVPYRVGGIGRIDIQYLTCSQEAESKEIKPDLVAGRIEVPESMARRFNFWRRVYSLWSKNQYVMHVGDFPEVVLEIHDSSRIQDLGDKGREKTMKPWFDVRRRQYQQILIKLQRMKEIQVAELTPAERRVFELFKHIERKDKYLAAAQSIRMQRGQREYIESGLATASKYLPHVEESFRKEGVPAEFARVAFIESSFNLQAMSKVGASGVYQIMPETGRDYLVVSGGIDERNDPIKASHAAAKLLMLNYKILGEWPLAITAYNHGVGGIRRAMQAVGSRDLATLIEKYDGPNFGFASKNFYAGFLGLLATLDKADRVFPRVDLNKPLQFQVVHVGGKSIDAVKSKYKLSSWALMGLNPDISRSFVKSGGVFPNRYKLKVPVSNGSPEPLDSLVVKQAKRKSPLRTVGFKSKT
jgi:hypothetical protein